jgi:hypothetical protein
MAQRQPVRGSEEGESSSGQRKSGDRRRGVACSDTRGREQGASSDRLSGQAAGRCFMAQVHTWQRCCSSWRQLETELQHVGPGVESGD